MKRPNLILGVVINYELPPLLPFLNSLAASGFTGETHFFCRGMTAAMLAALRDRGVRVHPFRYRSASLCNSWGRFWPWLRPLGSLRLLREVADLFVLRYFLYRDFLARHGDRYDQVLLTDVRDVAFQRDPFSETPGAGVAAFEEDARRTLGGCPLNSQWLREGFGPDALQRIADRPIFCAGTVMGTPRELVPFLGQLLRTIARGRQVSCVEQAALNLIMHTARPPGATGWRNDEGPVFNLCGLTDADLRLNAREELVRTDGTAFPILHEYDRVASVRQRIEARHGALAGPAPA